MSADNTTDITDLAASTLSDMSEISLSISNVSEEFDTSNTSTSTAAEDEIATPPQSPSTKSRSIDPSEWITTDPKTGLPKYNFPSLNKKREPKVQPTTTTQSSKENKPTSEFFTPLPPASDGQWITHDPQSGMIRYNFPSLNKKPKPPPSPKMKFDRSNEDLPSPPPSPAKKSGNAYLANTSPYTRPGATLAVVGMRTGAPQRPASPVGSSSSSERPHISMPKSQPLSRMLFSKISDNTPGGPVRKSAKPQKLIVPSKSYQTVFELPLTSSEFARRR